MNEQELAAHQERIRESGFTIVRDVLDTSSVAHLLAAMDELMESLEISFGTNGFLGFHTRRIFNLLARHPEFRRIPLDPTVLAIVEGLLDPGCLLSSLTAIEMQAGQAAQPLHADDGSIPLPRPHIPLTCIAIWALTDFTPENGATRIVPSSHRFDRIPRKGEDPPEVVIAEMTAGSVLVYNGSMWHGGGANRTDSRRVGIVSNFCAGWLRQEESQLLALDRELVRSFPARLQQLVGFSVYRGQFGHVDQVNPQVLVNPAATTQMVWEKMR